MPVKNYLLLPGAQKNDFRAMPAFVAVNKTQSACGVKWVCVFPGNPKLKKPSVYASVLLNSPTTGEPLAYLEATYLTAMRTAAASALASHYLANPNSKKLSLVGAGVQALFQLEALASIYNFKEIGVWGYRQNEAQNFCNKYRRSFNNLIPYGDVKGCVREADIIGTCTSSRKPLVRAEWTKPGSHINAIGADAKGKSELDHKLLRQSTIVVDELEQAWHSGEINTAVSSGILKRRHIKAELAQIVSGEKEIRHKKNVITIFDSTGLACLDIYFAYYVLNREKRSI